MQFVSIFFCTKWSNSFKVSYFKCIFFLFYYLCIFFSPTWHSNKKNMTEKLSACLCLYCEHNENCGIKKSEVPYCNCYFDASNSSSPLPCFYTSTNLCHHSGKDNQWQCKKGVMSLIDKSQLWCLLLLMSSQTCNNTLQKVPCRQYSSF